MIEKFLARRLNRRGSLHAVANAATVVTAATLFPQPSLSSGEINEPEIRGTTFNHLASEALGISYKESFDVVASWKPNKVRFCVCWSEVEEKGFEALRYLIPTAEKYGIKAVVAVGPDKAPVFPEFYLPEHIRRARNPNNKVFGTHGDEGDKSLEFEKQAIETVRDYPNVVELQVGNESENNIGFVDMIVRSELFKQQKQLARELKRPHQTILTTSALNHWNPFTDEYYNDLEKTAELADEVGLNIYPRIPIKNYGYLDPMPWYSSKIVLYKNKLIELGKNPKITEIPGEPWEIGGVDMDKEIYDSYNPNDLVLIDSELARLGFNERWTWGATFAVAKLLRKKDPSWANAHKAVLTGSYAQAA